MDGSTERRGRQSPAACGAAGDPANTGAERSEKQTERAGRIRAIGARPRRRCKLDIKGAMRAAGALLDRPGG